VHNVFAAGPHRRGPGGSERPPLPSCADGKSFRKRPGLSPRDRSLVTVAVLAATYRPDQLISHLRLALANGLTQDELAEALTHLAFYAGWPSGMAALTQLKTITADTGSGASR
jgi:alkylhydroperoxidase/carboxymuconolactone decarboxylase family protein YurZ